VARCLTLCDSRCYKRKVAVGGAVAQLGARLDGIEEVEGSNPFGSTKSGEDLVSRASPPWRTSRGAPISLCSSGLFQ
jgi:hypothetical protein